MAKPIHIPGLSVESIQGVKGEMHDCVALTPFISTGVAKRSEADGAGNLSRLAEATAYLSWPLLVGGDPTSVVGVQG